jgi:hypothetical protein
MAESRGQRPEKRRREQGWGAAAAVAPYVDAAAAVPHGAMTLLPWTTASCVVAHGGMLLRVPLPATDR